jgi:histidinol-phosphate aminotransferase
LGRTLVDVPLGEPDFDLRGEELVAAARPGDLVFVCRPANPTGNLFPRGDVVALLDGLESKGAYTVVDEAYREFCHDTLVAEVTGGRWPKAIVLRTLSKAFRLAGLRVGYAIAPPPLVARMEEVRLPYNLSAASMVAALGMLARPELARRTAAACRRLREALSVELAGIPGLTVLPSHTNFLLVRTPCSGAAIVRALAERGVLIRCYPAEPRLAAAVRVSVGDRAANRRLVTALRAVLQDLLAGGGAETSPRQAT